MSQFDELLAQLKTAEDEQATLAKSLPAKDGEDDETIQAAAAEGDGAGVDEDEDEDEDGVDAGGEGDLDAPVAKSVTAIIDGVEEEAIDATEILKSLSGRVDQHESVLAKALESTLGTLRAQSEMIKSLTADVKKLAGQGAGRKTVLSVVEKPSVGDAVMAKSEDGMTPAQFMAKANAAFDAGKLTGQELTTADVALRSGVPIPAAIIAKALSV